MGTTRRSFLGLSAAAGGAIAAGGLAAGCAAAPEFPLRKQVGRFRTICPYCAVGCGMLVGVEGGRVVNVEGDPDHPINRGSLCSKGSGLAGTVNSPRRVTRPLHRAPGAREWREVDWGWALDAVARRVKATRDAHWIGTDGKGRTVRRTEAIAHVGSAALDNEECALLVKALRGMGLVWIEHQART